MKLFWIKWVRDSTGIMTAKLLAEKNNPRAEVVWGLAGFYKYETDRRGRLKKSHDQTAIELLAPITDAPKEFDKQEITQICVPHHG